MKYSLGFTTFNSAQYIERQLAKDYFKMSGGLVDEIIIQDDYTGDYNVLQKYQGDKVKIYQNPRHLFPLLGRLQLLSHCKNDWVLLMDCDNFLSEKTFEVLNSFIPEPGVIYMPGFAHPAFDFRSQYPDTLIDLKLAANRVGVPGVNWMNVLLNTGNYLVPRDEFLEVGKSVDESYSVCCYEVIYFNYLWLRSGRKLFCKKDYEYEHGLRDDSFYRTHGHLTGYLQEIYNMYYQHR